MDRIKVWIESQSHSSAAAAGANHLHGSCPASSGNGGGGGGGRISRFFSPPTVRTTSSYDDDERFTSTSLNMLSRYEGLNLSAEEAIRSSLRSPQDRSSFLEALCIRKSRTSEVSPSTASLVRSLEAAFGAELKRIVFVESAHNDHHHHHQPCSRRMSSDELPPTTPRHVRVRGSWGSSSAPAAVAAHHRQHQTTSSTSASSTGPAGPLDAQHRHHQHHRQAPAKSEGVIRRFFPDSDSRNGVGGGSGGPFFRSKRVKNLDWKLVEAIEQVQSLRLDGCAGAAVSSANNNNAAATAVVAAATTPRSHHITAAMGYTPPSPLTRLS